MITSWNVTQLLTFQIEADVSIHVTRMHQYHLTMVIASNLVNVSASFLSKQCMTIIQRNFYVIKCGTHFFQICMSRRVFTIEQSQALRYRQFQLVIQVGMVLSSKLEKLSMIYVWLVQYCALRQEVVSIKCISARCLEQLLQLGTLQWVKVGFIITSMVT